jgi:hypothetical protein
MNRDLIIAMLQRQKDEIDKIILELKRGGGEPGPEPEAPPGKAEEPAAEAPQEEGWSEESARRSFAVAKGAGRRGERGGTGGPKTPPPEPPAADEAGPGEVAEEP